jgi:hypothetical protein
MSHAPFQLWSPVTERKVPHLIKRSWPIDDRRSQSNLYTIQSIIFTYCFLYLRSSPPCLSSPRVWFNLYRFALKSGRFSFTKVRGSLLLCSESIRSSSRKHGDYPSVARQFCVPTQRRRFGRPTKTASTLERMYPMETEFQCKHAN